MGVYKIGVNKKGVPRVIMEIETTLLGRSQRKAVKPKMRQCKKWCILVRGVKAKKGIKQGLRVLYMCRDFGISCA